ncbi:MAG: radical SAM protein [Candidatus Nanoarchaeia archaeon]
MDALRIIVTNECNSYQLPRLENSPGVCRFCYRQTNDIFTDSNKINLIFDRLRDCSDIKKVIFTGGESLMSEHIEEFINRSYALNKYVLIHTNGILLDQKMVMLDRKVSGISIPLDGSKSEIQDYYRGKGFFDLSINNLNRLKEHNIDIGINTFVSGINLHDISKIAELISEYHPTYWLISQFRRADLSNRINNKCYYTDYSEFTDIVHNVREKFPNLKIYSVTSYQKSYPERIWLHADGNVFTDLINSSNKVFLCNLEDYTLQEAIHKMSHLKSEERGNLNKVALK